MQINIKNSQLECPIKTHQYIEYKLSNWSMIFQEICERLKTIVNGDAQKCENCFALSKLYRVTYPHFGDFQLILKNLHKIEEEMGQPKSQITENDLAKAPPIPAGE